MNFPSKLKNLKKTFGVFTISCDTIGLDKTIQTDEAERGLGR